MLFADERTPRSANAPMSLMADNARCRLLFYERPIRQEELAELADILHAGITVQVDPEDKGRVGAHLMGGTMACSEMAICRATLARCVVRTTREHLFITTALLPTKCHDPTFDLSFI